MRITVGQLRRIIKEEIEANPNARKNLQEIQFLQNLKKLFGNDGPKDDPRDPVDEDLKKVLDLCNKTVNCYEEAKLAASEMFKRKMHYSNLYEDIVFCKNKIKKDYERFREGFSVYLKSDPNARISEGIYGMDITFETSIDLWNEAKDKLNPEIRAVVDKAEKINLDFSKELPKLN